MKIFYEQLGRLGNNLFQYFAAKIISHHCGHTITWDRAELSNPAIVTDQHWNQMRQAASLPLHQHDVLLYGFFQTMDVYRIYREPLKRLIVAGNNDPINAHVSVSDLCQITAAPDPTEVVVHLRLDDYIQDGRNSNIVHPAFYQAILDKIAVGRPVTIVCDQLRHEWEHAYVASFSRYRPKVFTSDLISDFNYLRQATTIVSSNSTFSYLASFLSDAAEIYLPWTNFYKEQTLVPFHERCWIVNTACVNPLTGETRNYF
jgi:hypothetical protein